MFYMCATRWLALAVVSLLAIGSTFLIAAQLRGADQCHIITPPATLPSGSTGGGSGGGFALVELFTSEGCSSCPPADKVLSKMVDDARKDGTRVYPLAFHVDYWNNLGWADRYSSADYSKRQHDYADALGNQQIYTPQMIVNGSVEFVGSDSVRASRETTKALSQAFNSTVSITAKVENEHVTVKYTTTGAAGARLNIAIVERGLNSEVKRGENGGRQLHHDNVVRGFKQLAAEDSGEVELDLPAQLQLENASVIAFVSDTKTRAVRAASSLDLATASRTGK